MRTSKPFSSISFNSTPFLKGVLDDMIGSSTLSFYAFIDHKAEPAANNDDVVGKDHKHIYGEPGHLISTDDFRKEFLETDPSCDKPRGILPCRPVKVWADWYLYALHDKTYLATKGKTRNYMYTKEDIITSDPEYLQQLISNIDWKAINLYQIMTEYVIAKKSFAEFMVAETVPVSIVHQYFKAYKELFKFYHGEYLF